MLQSMPPAEIRLSGPVRLACIMVSLSLTQVVLLGAWTSQPELSQTAGGKDAMELGRAVLVSLVTS